MDGDKDVWKLVTEGEEWFWKQIVTLKGKDRRTGKARLAGQSQDGHESPVTESSGEKTQPAPGQHKGLKATLWLVKVQEGNNYYPSLTVA